MPGGAGMKPEEVAAALGAKVNPNSASVNSLSAGADAADAALARLKGSPGSSLEAANAATAALDSRACPPPTTTPPAHHVALASLHAITISSCHFAHVCSAVVVTHCLECEVHRNIVQKLDRDAIKTLLQASY